MNSMTPGCIIADAKFAVCGTSINGTSGILNWFGDIITAHRFRRDVNTAGGNSYVSAVYNIDGLYDDVQKTVFIL